LLGVGGTGGGGTGGTGAVGGAGGTGGTEPVDPCDAEPTWEAFTGPFVKRYCLGCHSERRTGVLRSQAPVGVDFDTEELAIPHAADMRQMLESREMPPNRTVPDCEIEKFGE